jgi:hypothetical protein
MTSQPTQIGIAIGLVAAVAYVGVSLLCKQRPALSRCVVVLVATVGAVVGAIFGYGIVFLELKPIPALADQRLTMIVGAIALVWITVEAIVDEFMGPIRYARAATEREDQPTKQTSVG